MNGQRRQDVIASDSYELAFATADKMRQESVSLHLLLCAASGTCGFSDHFRLPLQAPHSPSSRRQQQEHARPDANASAERRTTGRQAQTEDEFMTYTSQPLLARRRWVNGDKLDRGETKPVDHGDEISLVTTRSC